jgi:hypothetical protein
MAGKRTPAKGKAAAKRPAHRPLQLTEAKIKKIAEAAEEGKPRRLQAAAAGVSRRTLQVWLEKGQPIVPTDESGKPIDGAVPEYPRDLYGKLAAEMESAEAWYEQKLLEHIEGAASATKKFYDKDGKLVSEVDAGQWQAAAWILERRNPDEYAKTERSKVELTGKDGGAVEVIERAGRDLNSRLASLAARINQGSGTGGAGADAG